MQSARSRLCLRGSALCKALLTAHFCLLPTCCNPSHAPSLTPRRQCAAGLQSIADAAAGIAAGYYDIGIAGGK